MSIKVGDKVRYYFPVEDTDGDYYRKSDEVAPDTLTVTSVDGVTVSASNSEHVITAPKSWFIKVRK